MNNKINFLILGKITNSKNLLKLVRSLNKNLIMNKFIYQHGMKILSIISTK